MNISPGLFWLIFYTHGAGPSVDWSGVKSQQQQPDNNNNYNNNQSGRLAEYNPVPTSSTHTSATEASQRNLGTKVL